MNDPCIGCRNLYRIDGAVKSCGNDVLCARFDELCRYLEEKEKTQNE